MTLPALLPWDDVQARLRVIFPDGTAHRNYVTRDLAASTVFVALYVGAIDGSGTYFGPKHVYRMSDEQAALDSEAERQAYAVDVLKPGGRGIGTQWYADNSREPIRDETLREGLVMLGAATELAGIPTTSSRPRYALQPAFAALFDPALTGLALDQAIADWQAKALTKGALARIAIVWAISRMA